VSTYQWLLALHMTGAFLFFGGSVAAGVFNVVAMRRERPSEVALFLKLIRFTLIPVGIGIVSTLVLGLWLVHHRGYSFGAFWVWAALVLWVISNALGGRGGAMQEKARKLAMRLAAEGDRPSAELRAMVRDRGANALNVGAGVALLLILVLMVWKPGS
jgi:uncharacterized membrane protein